MIDVEKYKETLLTQQSQNKISGKTVGEYIACVERLKIVLGEKDDCKSISEAIIKICTGTEQGHKYIAAVKKYERDVLAAPKSLLYGEELQRLRQCFKQQPIGRDLKLQESTYSHKINALRNEKLKVAYRLQLRSGLRIAEIASLRKEDISFNAGDRITLNVREGKGGKSRNVDVIPDKYICKKIKEIIEPLKDSENIFYSAAYLKKKAVEYGLPTHDLRRLNSKDRYRDERKKGQGRRESRREVQKQLGHKKPRITSAYLGTEWEEE